MLLFYSVDTLLLFRYFCSLIHNKTGDEDAIKMAATFGKIESFTGNKDEWEIYVERLEVYLTANNLEEITPETDGSNANAVKQRADKRRAIF